MARNYLAIQGSSVKSECTFSGGGITGTDRRNRLGTATFEALQVLKSAYKTDTITTHSGSSYGYGGALTDDELDFMLVDVDALDQ